MRLFCGECCKLVGAGAELGLPNSATLQPTHTATRPQDFHTAPHSPPDIGGSTS